MKKEEIIQLFIEKIPEHHILNEHVHVLRKFVISKRVHPFIEMMAESLEYLNNLIPGYASRMVDWISSLVNEKEYEQNFAVFGEILVLFNIAKLADNVSGERYIEAEPTSIKDSKNPEFRSAMNGIYYAGEVKTPSLAKYIYGRQDGIQVTTHLPDRNLLVGEKIVNPNLYRILDNLKSAEKKFKEYMKSEEYKNDFRFLFIVWDDFINEPISALTNSYCGLFTENSFYPDSDFKLIDGVFIIRHLHQFHRMLRNEELMYDFNHAFDWYSKYTPIAFIQNPKGREVPRVFMEKFNAIDPTLMFSAEYRPTDWVDWRTGIAFSGLNSIPQEYHKKIAEIIQNSTESFIERALPESANFGVINLDKMVEINRKPNEDIDYENILTEFAEAVEMAKELQEFVEKKEKDYQERLAEEMRQVQLRTLARALGNGNYIDFTTSQTSRMVRPTQPSNLIKKSVKIGRNEKCQCGSGLKYKKCKCFNNMKSTF